MIGWERSPDWIVTWQSSEEAIDFGSIEYYESKSHGRPSLIFTHPFLSNSSENLLDRFSDRFGQVVSYFPEIKGEIKIGLTNSYRGLAIIEFLGKEKFNKLAFPPLAKLGLPSTYVIGHELMHIVQAEKKDIPGTERATDIFTLARLPPRLLDHPPIYLKIPNWVRKNWSENVLQPIFSRLAHELAIDSIISRRYAQRYIQNWELRFKEETESKQEN